MKRMPSLMLTKHESVSFHCFPFAFKIVSKWNREQKLVQRNAITLKFSSRWKEPRDLKFKTASEELDENSVFRIYSLPFETTVWFLIQHISFFLIEKGEILRKTFVPMGSPYECVSFFFISWRIFFYLWMRYILD